MRPPTPSSLVSIVLAVVVVAGGCASSGGAFGGDDSDSGSSGDVITSEELRQYETQYGSALDLVDRRRSQWLRPRRSRMTMDAPSDNVCDPAAPGAAQCRQSLRDQVVLPVVYLNGTQYGPVESLGSFRTTSIERLEYMDPRDATTRFGTGVDGGVILITLR